MRTDNSEQASGSPTSGNFRQIISTSEGYHYRITVHKPSPSGGDVREDIIHHVWANQLLRNRTLKTVSGDSVRVRNPGIRNLDSGPDFAQATVIIGDLEWRGDVEIHIRSADWYNHNHHTNSRYNGVILHLTLYGDDQSGQLERQDGTILPEVILADHLDTPVRKLVRQFHTRRKTPIPCSHSWNAIPDEIKIDWIQYLGAKRLEERMDHLEEEFIRHPDLEKLLYYRVFRALGYTQNADAMEHLAQLVPLSFARTFSSPTELEALYLGMAGLLPDPNLMTAVANRETYPERLLDRFNVITSSSDFRAMEKHEWEFSGVRPANNPYLRIAQGAALLQPGNILHSDPIGQLVEALSQPHAVSRLEALLSPEPSSFWTQHHTLDQSTPERTIAIGRSRRRTILTNAFLPILLLHANQNRIPIIPVELLRILGELPAESDSIIRIFSDLGTAPSSRLESQGMHHLYRRWCSEQRCINCQIGRYVLGERPKER